MAQQAVVPLKEQPCPAHERGKICMVCKDCDFQKVCLTCIGTTHQRHHCIEIEEFVKIRKHSLKCLLTEVKDVKYDIETRLQYVRKAGKFISYNTTSVKRQLTRKAETLKRLIDEWLKENHQKCNSLYKENREIIDTIEKNLADQLDNLISVITRSEVAITSSSYEDVTSLEEALSYQSNAIKPTIPVVQELQLNTGKNNVMATILGSIQTREVDFDHQIPTIKQEKIPLIKMIDLDLSAGDFNGIPVTIKDSTANGYGPLPFNDIFHEAKILRTLHHRNVIHLRGLLEDINQPAVVLEDVSQGYLHVFLSEKMEGYSLGLLLDFSTQVASGMEYVSSMRIVHRNLAARNILMTNNATLKVANFSEAVELEVDSEQWSSDEIDTKRFKWTAVEIFERGIYSVASDVWSFGVLVSEIFTKGAVLCPEMQIQDVKSRVIDGYRMPKPSRCPDNVYAGLLKCWDKDPQQRPTFEDIGDVFDEILHTIAPETQNTASITDVEGADTYLKNTRPDIEAKVVSQNVPASPAVSNRQSKKSRFPKLFKQK